MLGPSGFFQTIDGGDSPISSSDLEIIHDSEVGFNTLYKVSKNGRFFVYKALKKEYAGNPLYEELLKKDFNIGFSLTHSNICQYYGMVNLPLIGNCIVMEWVDGCSLETMIEQGRIDKANHFTTLSKLSNGSPLPIKTMLVKFLSVLLPLSALTTAMVESISPAVKFLINPFKVEAQNLQPILQPT